MPGGNSTSRPNNRKEKQAVASMSSRMQTAKNIIEKVSTNEIDQDIGLRKAKSLLQSEGARKDYNTLSERSLKEHDRKIGKRLMIDKSTPKGTGQGRAYNKGGYCGASNPAARPMKKSK